MRTGPSLLSCRDIEADDVTIWLDHTVHATAAQDRALRHPVGSRWHVDDTDVKGLTAQRYVYRAIDQAGQVIDLFCLYNVAMADSVGTL
jgi:putative transposase